MRHRPQSGCWRNPTSAHSSLLEVLPGAAFSPTRAKRRWRQTVPLFLPANNKWRHWQSGGVQPPPRGGRSEAGCPAEWSQDPSPPPRPCRRPCQRLPLSRSLRQTKSPAAGSGGCIRHKHLTCYKNVVEFLAQDPPFCGVK